MTLVELEKVIDILIDWEVLEGKEIIPRINPTHGTCCTCQECGRNYDDCVCEHNDILTRIRNAGPKCNCERCTGVKPPEAYYEEEE